MEAQGQRGMGETMTDLPRLLTLQDAASLLGGKITPRSLALVCGADGERFEAAAGR